MRRPVTFGGLFLTSEGLKRALAAGCLLFPAAAVSAGENSPDATVTVDTSVEVQENAGEDAKPAKPAKPAKSAKAGRGRGTATGNAARPGANARSGGGTSVSRGFASGAMGGGQCGPAMMSSLLGGGMPGFNMLAAIGVQSNYGGGGGFSNGGSSGGADAGGAALASTGNGTEVDVSVRVRVKLGGGESGEKECHKEGQKPGTSNGSNSSNSGSNSTDTASSTDSSASGLEGRILAFAQSKVGTQVGNGECWTLAAEALKAAEAEPPLLYVFGREVATSDVRPGMVLQFEAARFEGPGYYQVYGAPHHTAIVASVRGTTLRILQQNVNGDRTVQYGDLKLDDLVSGTMTVYQPLPKGSSLANSAR